MNRLRVATIAAIAILGACADQSVDDVYSTSKQNLYGDTRLLKDIAPGSDSSYPEEFAEAGGVAFFIANDGTGRRLYRTDGTESGTIPWDNCNWPTMLTGGKSWIYFECDDGVHGRELWRASATTPPEMVGDLSPGNLSTYFGTPVVIGDTAYFLASVEYSWTYELYMAGAGGITQLVGAEPRSLTAIGNTLYFATDTGGGFQPWKTDGTTRGTVPLGVINPTGPSSPREFVAFANKVFFTANDGVHGEEIWYYNPSTGAMAMFKDFVPGAGSPFYNTDFSPRLTVAGDRLYFVVNGSEVWMTDGDTSATSVNVDRVFVSPALGMGITQVAVAGNSFYFGADDGSTGVELHRATGIAATQNDPASVLVADIVPGNLTSGLQYLLSTGDEVYFQVSQGNPPSSTSALWRANFRGASLVSNLSSPRPLGYFSSKGLVIYAGGDNMGWEPYVVDVRRPRQVTDAVGRVFPVDDTERKVVINNTMYFASDDGSTGVELYATAGGEAWLVADLNTAPGASSYPKNLTKVGNILYFAAQTGATGREVFRYDPAIGGVPTVLDVTSGAGSTNPTDITAAGAGTFYFVGNDGAGGSGLYKSNGTLAGTSLIAGTAGTSPQKLTYASSKMFFVATDAVYGDELWSFSGTTAAMVKDINIGEAGSQISEMVEYGAPFSALYFVAFDGSEQQLWKSTGTAASTVKVSTTPGYGLMPSGLTVLNSGGLLLFAGDSTGSDPYAPKTLHRLRSNRAEEVSPDCAYPDNFLSNGTHTYFSCDTMGDGFELFRTNVTASNTPAPIERIDIRQGPGDSNPLPLAFVGGRLYMSADDGIAGQELMVSEVSTIGISANFDFVPGARGSHPKGFISVTGGYAFSATNSSGSGRYLWFADNL